MKKLLLLALFPIIYSCAPKIIPVKGNYATLPMTFNSDKPVAEVWDKLIDLFAQKGLSIKLIDKSSGLIVSDNSGITATWENKSGTLVHPDAYIVVPKRYNNNAQREVGVTTIYTTKSKLKNPDLVKGEWNVRIKSSGSGTIINVNLVNVQYLYYTGVSYSKVPTWSALPSYKTTGQFEKLIADYIK